MNNRESQLEARLEERYQSEIDEWIYRLTAVRDRHVATPEIYLKLQNQIGLLETILKRDVVLQSQSRYDREFENYFNEFIDGCRDLIETYDK